MLFRSLLSNMRDEDGRLYHSTVIGCKANGPSFLEDYAFLSSALISLFRSTFDEMWLKKAEETVSYAIQHFSDLDSGSFWYTSDLDPKLFSRKQEIQDNVIPASVSELCNVLFELGTLLDNKEWTARAKHVLELILADIPRYSSAYSNWLNLAMKITRPLTEVIICGPESKAIGKELRKQYLPGIILGGNEDGKTTAPLFQNRFIPDKTLIHVCQGNSCHLPVESVEDAMQLIRNIA